MVLCYRCPYLYDEFKKSTINNEDNIRIIRIIQKPHVSAKNFDIIIKITQNCVNLRGDRKFTQFCGISQNKTLSSKIDDWIDKDFQILENTLQQCLPQIRYFQISGEGIMEKVFPYQQILDKKLWANILKYSMAPNKPITRQFYHLAKYSPANFQIVDILFKLHHQLLQKNKQLKLYLGLIRKNLCDRKANVIVVAKTKDKDEIIGGYNPIGWNYNLINKFSETNDSFIFSLKNRNIKNSILSRVKVPSKAIYNDLILGPNFFQDLWMHKTRSFCYHGHYDIPIKEASKFSIDYYEVFQISKR
ncbi:hypothetical protein Glove_23g83 [Diversispora epigaea]|uniref:TLDc domain-containing protein n=1 Tax=Diversispora epigaea TaxID=1348612 RepID=A0A397JV56_9GLOM|nr:hypothetical protein Glove_23g83 [Diversispora epigaea]